MLGASGLPTQAIDLGDPGTTIDGDTPRDDLPPYEGPAETLRGPRMGRGQRRPRGRRSPRGSDLRRRSRDDWRLNQVVRRLVIGITLFAAILVIGGFGVLSIPQPLLPEARRLSPRRRKWPSAVRTTATSSSRLATAATTGLILYPGGKVDPVVLRPDGPPPRRTRLSRRDRPDAGEPRHPRDRPGQRRHCCPPGDPALGDRWALTWRIHGCPVPGVSPRRRSGSGALGFIQCHEAARRRRTTPAITARLRIT